MQFTDEEWLAFANKLERATELGAISWFHDDEAWNQHTYYTTIPGNAKYELYSRDEDGQYPYVLEISDLDGTKLSEFTTVPYGDEWDKSSAQRVSAMLDRLYGRVTRLVTGAPQKAESLLRGLDDLLPPESETSF